MLGETITDNCGAEGKNTVRGMGLLSMQTSFEPEKTRTRVKGRVCQLAGGLEKLTGKKVSGYEIHMGRTEHTGDCLLELFQEHFTGSNTEGPLPDKHMAKYDGCYRDNVMGTYIHGIFDEEEFRQAFVELLCDRKGIAYERDGRVSFREYREMQYNKLADILRKSLNMQRIYEILNEKE